MGRAPCCDKANVKKGPWSPEEDLKLKEYIEKYGTGGNWIALPQKAGLKRCGKSCRLRWLNYLRPNIKHGEFSADEDRIILSLFASIGSRWSIIAAHLPGRTDNDIKNYWNTKLKKKLMGTLIPNQDHRFIIKPSPPSQMLPPPSNMIQQSSSPLLLPNFPSQPLSSSLLYRENMCYQPSCYAPAKSPLLFSGLDFSSPTSSVPTVSPLTNVSYPMSNHALDSILQATPGDFQYDYSQMMNKQERTHHHKHLQAFMISEESHHSQTIGVWEPEEKCNDGYYGEGHMSSSSSSAIEYDLEEVNRLIINGSGSNNNSVNAISSFLSNPLY